MSHANVDPAAPQIVDQRREELPEPAAQIPDGFTAASPRPVALLEAAPHPSRGNVGGGRAELGAEQWVPHDLCDRRTGQRGEPVVCRRRVKRLPITDSAQPQRTDAGAHTVQQSEGTKPEEVQR